MQTKISIPCQQCGKGFEVWPCRARLKPRFCGHACYAANRIGSKKKYARVDYLIEQCNANIGDGPCLEWPFARNELGYGTLRYKGKTALANRVAYDLFIGPLTPDMLALHRCDNPPCFRPSHLFAGTNADNSQDCTEKGRHSDNRGLRNPRRKISEDDVKVIRAEYRFHSREHGTVALARRFGLTSATVLAIIKRRLWAHVK